MKWIVIACLFCPLMAFAASPDNTGSTLPADLHGIGIDQKLGGHLPLDTRFRDETGTSVPLSSFFHGKPVVLALVYYRCPMLCSRILAGIVSGLKPLSLKPGRDFEVVAVSFNPEETPQEAAAKRDQYTKQYSGKAGSKGWHFLVGDQDSIKAVTEAVGFHYRWDPKTQMFIHGSGIMVATPEGELSRYFYGVDYQPKDLKLGLIESSHNTIGSPVDQVLLFCYHYDPNTGKYGAVVLNVLRGAAALLLVVMGTAFLLFWRRERQHHQLAR